MLWDVSGWEGPITMRSRRYSKRYWAGGTASQRDDYWTLIFLAEYGLSSTAKTIL